MTTSETKFRSDEITLTFEEMPVVTKLFMHGLLNEQGVRVAKMIKRHCWDMPNLPKTIVID